MEYNVFISHSSVNEQEVKSLCAYLEDHEIKCFVSYRDIPSGESYPGVITRAIRESEMLLLVLSKESNESTQVDRELTLANDQKKKLSCFRLEEIEYSDDKAYLMSGVNWMNAFPVPEEHYFELLQDICRQLGREVPQEEETEEDRRKRHELRLGQMLLAASNGNSIAQHDLGRAYHEGVFGLKVNNEEAFRWYLKAAKKGDIKAENVIGVFYATGTYVEKNMKEAVKWYRLAALSGNEVAQSNLGKMYLYGDDGIDKDVKESIKWLKLASDQGFSPAMVNLGDCYFKGKGVEQSLSLAVEYYSRASELDNDRAQIALAKCYCEGLGVEKDIDKGVELLIAAAENNSKEAMKELARLYDEGKYVEKNPSLAFDYLQKAAKGGHRFAMYLLSKWFYRGYGCEKDLIQSMEWLNSSANNGYAPAQNRLGDIYSAGDEDLGIEIDPEKALYWYEKAIDQGSVDAMVGLGLCYSLGGCLPLDDLKASELFTRAANLGDRWGQYFISNNYQQGDGVEQSDEEAFNWCLKSAEQELPTAMARLGEYYFYGVGTEQNFEKAVEWLKKAKANNDEDALYLLGLCYEHGYGVEKSIEKALPLYLRSSDNYNKKAKEAVARLLEELNNKAEKNDAESLFVLGNYYSFYKEDNKKGTSFFIKSAEQGYEKAYNSVAWSLHLLGESRDDMAINYALKAVKAFPDKEYVWDTLATIYQDLEKYQEALDSFEKCLHLCEENGKENRVDETKEKIEQLKKLMS